MGETEISWTHRPGTVGRSWNPGQGCSRVSDGCRHCYAERMAARFAKDGWSHGLINLRTGKWNGKVRIAPHKITEPLRWQKPSTVFVNSMTDMFHEKYTNEEIAAVFGVMAACPQHTFQMLTKRATRMREWFQWVDGVVSERNQKLPVIWDRRAAICWEYAVETIKRTGAAIESSVWNSEMMDRVHTIAWPLPNLWLGVSVESQSEDHRIHELLHTPAIVRFLSLEPLLGPIDLTSTFADATCRKGALWVIAGCESGPGARPCEVDWLRWLRDQCANASVPFFLKQAEESVDLDPDRQLDIGDDDSIAFDEGSKLKGRGPRGCRIVELPYLDGEQHAAFPEVPRG